MSFANYVRTYQVHTSKPEELSEFSKPTYTIVTSKLRKMDLKREGNRRDGVWKDGQTLVLLTAGKHNSKYRESNAPFLFPASEYGSTFRKEAITPVSYERCNRRSEFRVREIPLTREWTTCEL